MKQALRLLAIVIVALWAAQSPAAAALVQLPEGTPVMLRATQDYLSNEVVSNQLINLVVVNPVRVNGVTLVAANAPAHASVAYHRGSGVGFGGEMMLLVMDMQAVDGSWIPLRATAAPGDGRSRLIPDSAYDRVSAPFPSGKNLRLSAQASFNAWTDAARTYDVRGRKITREIRKPAPGKRLVLVEDGTVVTVHATEDISSGRVDTGDRVNFVTSAPVTVNGTTIIEQGAPAFGTVLLCRKAQMANKGGLLVISIDRVQAVDGSQIRLSSSNAGRGASNRQYTLAVSLVVPVVGLAIEGRESVIPADKDLPVYVMLNRWVQVPSR